MTNLNVLELLSLRNPDFRKKKIKMVRHSDDKKLKVSIDDLIDKDFLEIYQSYQSKTVFNDTQLVVTFVATEKNRAKLYGVYKVEGSTDASEARKSLPEDFPVKCVESSKICYNLIRLQEYDYLYNRVVIEWSKDSINWCKPKTEFVVHEILPEGQPRKVFDDYLDFTLQMSELKALVNNTSPNNEWKARLSAVSGIYLILESTTGQQYIGSAYGDDGIWGRWEVYAKTEHGDNKKLIILLEKEPNCSSNFIFSILMTLPKSYTPQKIIAIEERFKKKLGTRATGLNH